MATVLNDATATVAPLADHADHRLRSYLKYLQLTEPAPDPLARLIRLADLAITERAITPVGAGPYQRVDLVQLSADTRSMLAPSRDTAEAKLTGLQLHHFGAFYKRSWRANDWMWGRLDAAGWLVHALLSPPRLIEVTRHIPTGNRRDWLLQQIADRSPEDLPARDDTGTSAPTRNAVRSELAFLDEQDRAVPPGLPLTSMWLASAWQRQIVADELPALAAEIGRAAPDRAHAAALDPEAGIDWSPPESQRWAARVRAAGEDVDALCHLLDSNPVPNERLATDRGSRLMVRTVAKAAATSAAALASVQEIPAPVRPAVTTARTVAVGGYRVADATGSRPPRLIVVGLGLLVLGFAAAIQSATVLGVGGLAVAAVGGYLLTFGTWQASPRLLPALAAVTLAAAVGALCVPVVREFLFGTSTSDGGWVGRHVHWLAAAWWHPLLAVGILALLVTFLAAAATLPRRPIRSGRVRTATEPVRSVKRSLRRR